MAGNVAVTGLAARQGDDTLTLQAGVRNTGTAPVAGSLQLLAESQLVGVQQWRLEPGAETYLTWSHLPVGPRWYEARLAGMDSAANALANDDRAWVAVAAPGEPAILLVSPGNSFLERALGSHGGLRAFRAAPADWPGLTAQGTIYPLTVLDRLWPDPFPQGSALLVGPPVGEEVRPGQVWPRPDHPLLRHVDWSEVQVGTARRLPLDAGWETVIDSDGGPLLAVREDGGRRQAVLAFDLSTSDLPLRPAFPILLANLLDWLLPRPDAAPAAASPGAAVTIEPSPLAQQVWVESAGGERYDLAPPWPPRPFRPPAPGLYRVFQAGPAGQQESLLVAAGYHPLEAALTPQVPALPAQDGAPPSAARGAVALWPWLAVAVLLLSLAEWWLDARGR
jgi:hypothetical protein